MEHESMNRPVGVAILSGSRATGALFHIGKHKQRLALVASLFAVDCVALLIGLTLANQLRFGDTPASFSGTAMAFPVSVYLLSAIAVNANSGETLINLAATLKRGLLALGITALFLFLGLFAAQDSDLVSGTIMATGFGIGAICMMFFRTGHTYYAKVRLNGALYCVLALDDGDFPTASGTALPVRLGQAFDPANITVKDYHRLAGFLSSADGVVVRCNRDRRDFWVQVLQSMSVNAQIHTREFTNTQAPAAESFGWRPTQVVARTALGLRARLCKRAFDGLVASLALLWLAPLLLLVAIAIKLESQGPVFSRQQRIGQHNRLFGLYKFRSMRIETRDAGQRQSGAREEERLTRIGRFIRRLNLDELPQLLNVLKGDMSIVGPKAHPVSANAKAKLFREVDERYWYRHACQPGLTGIAQVRRHRGATHQECYLTDSLEADLAYPRTWSLPNDIEIIFKTLSVLVQTNAN